MKRFTRVFLLFIIIALAGCSRNPLQSMSAVNDYQKGVESYESGNYEDAIECFATAVDNELPDKLIVYAYSYMGHCHFAQENLTDAEEMYQSALATGRESAMCNTNLGILYRTCEAYEKAEQHYLTALAADASYAQALASLGVLYSVSGRAEEAVPLLEQAIEAETESSAVYHANLAYAYTGVGRFAEAREQLAIADQKGYLKEDYARILAHIEESMSGTTVTPEQADTVSTSTSMPTTIPIPTSTPIPTNTPTPTSTPIPTNMPTPTVTPTPFTAAGKKIVIDPGHQSKGNYEKEPVGPGATELKTKVSSGTQGVTTKVPEYRFTLELSLKLREVLEKLGYQVLMTRETAEVDISNVERAEFANEVGADIFIRIHADGAENAAASGISVLYPSAKNPYVAELSPESKKLAQCLLDGMCETTGAKRRGIIERDDLSGTNWAEMPVVLVEAGFMTNAEEEKKLVSASYQELLVQGIVNGIEEYFNE